MEEEKKICPNCGKELTKSARKCKYCETRIEPVKITKEEKLTKLLAYGFFFIIIAVIVIALILTCKTAISALGFLNEHIDWSVVKTVGIICIKILLVISAVIACIIGVLAENKIYKILSCIIIGCVVLNWISEHLEEIAFVLGTVLFLGAGLFLNGGKSGNNRTPQINKETSKTDAKKDEPTIGDVVIKGNSALIYDVNGIQIGCTGVSQGSIIISCTGKSFSVRDKNVVKTYNARGLQISCHSV